MEHFKQGDCVLVSNDNKHWYHRHFYRIDDVWCGTGKALVYAEGKSPWTVSRKHEDQYKLYELWKYCKMGDSSDD